MEGNKKIAINSVVIFVRLIVTSIIGVFASRLVLDALGASDYGLYNVVGGIVVVLNVFNNAMLSTTYRYIAFELGKGENGDVRKIFNASFLIHVCFAIVIVILGLTVGEWYINNYLNIPVGKLEDALFVFHFSIVTTALSTLLVPYQGLIVAYEKFSVLAIRDIVTRLLYLLVIILILNSDTNRLRLYSVIQFGYHLIHSGIFLLYCLLKYQKDIKPHLTKDFGLYKDMISFAWWTLFGAIAALGKSQGSALVLNFFFGTIVNAAFAVAGQIENLIQMFARSLNNAAIPQITKNVSGGNSERSITLTSYISKYTFILMTLVAFPILLEMDFILGLWLKDVPSGATDFCKLMILGALLSSLGEGIPALVNATGNIKTYQLVFHSFTLLGLPIAYVLLKFGYGQNTLLVVYCFIYALSTIVRLILLKLIYKFEISKIIKISYVRILYMCIPLILVYWFYNTDSFSILTRMSYLFFAELLLILDILIIGTDSKEKEIVRRIVFSRFSKK